MQWALCLRDKEDVMVAFLRLYEEKGGFFARFKKRFRKVLPEIQQIPVEGGLPFFIIHTPVYRDEIPWEEISEIVRINHLNLTLPPGMSLPKEQRISLFQMEEFQRVVGFNTFLYLLERFKAPAIKRSVGVVDLRGSFINEFTRLIDLAGDITIVTSRPYLYENLKDWAMEQRGAAIHVCGDIHRIERYRTVFLPNGLMMDIPGGGGIFSCKEAVARSRRIVTGQEICLPEEYLALLPDGYDPYVFAAVLYEQCNVKTLNYLVYQKFMLDDREINLFDALSVLGGT